MPDNAKFLFHADSLWKTKAGTISWDLSPLGTPWNEAQQMGRLFTDVTDNFAKWNVRMFPVLWHFINLITSSAYTHKFLNSWFVDS